MLPLAQAEVCAGTVAEVIQSVVNGADGCVFCFGHTKLGEYVCSAYTVGSLVLHNFYTMVRICFQLFVNFPYHDVLISFSDWNG